MRFCPSRCPSGLAALLLLSPLLVAQSDKRPRWDQDKAIAMVRNVLAIEQEGQPWDRIAWLTDPAEAARKASRSGRPIFVYLYLKKNVGPKAAPC